MPRATVSSEKPPRKMCWMEGAAVLHDKLGICCVKKVKGSTLTVRNRTGTVTKVHKSATGKVTPKLGALVFAWREDGHNKGSIERAIVTRVAERRPTDVEVRFFDQVLQTIPLDDAHIAVCLEKHCSWCGQAKSEIKLYKCECEDVLYCSLECQKLHWTAVHRKFCKRKSENAIQTKVLHMFNLLDASGQLVTSNRPAVFCQQPAATSARPATSASLPARSNNDTSSSSSQQEPDRPPPTDEAASSSASTSSSSAKRRNRRRRQQQTQKLQLPPKPPETEDDTQQRRDDDQEPTSPTSTSHCPGPAYGATYVPEDKPTSSPSSPPDSPPYSPTTS
mmetsp:Transcript_7952/g.24558  ORF Transcript_7952/g.24558 Transcript_7952/m.24558 type:complete len:335 (-) Transcript_7952:316-1320(-)